MVAIAVKAVTRRSPRKNAAAAEATSNGAPRSGGQAWHRGV